MLFLLYLCTCFLQSPKFLAICFSVQRVDLLNCEICRCLWMSAIGEDGDSWGFRGLTCVPLKLWWLGCI